MSIIDNIIKILKEKNLTQNELCAYLGITTSTMSTWKTRNTDPPSKYILRICEFLNVSPELLLSGKGKKTTTFDLNENEKELIELFDQLSDREQIKMIGRMEAWIAEKNND